MNRLETMNQPGHLRTQGPSRLLVAVAGLLLAVVFVLVNPHFNGDAPFYAASLADSGRPTWMPGHALWEPVAFMFIRAAAAIGIQLDTLLAMQIISAVATAALVVVTYDFARRMGLTCRSALGGAALLAFTANSLVMGGGGYAATSLSLATMIAARALVRLDGEPWRIGDGAIAVTALALGWGAWGVAVLAYPAIFVVAAIGSSGTPLRRMARGGALVVTAGLVTLILAAAIWRGPADATDLGLLAWLDSASHSIVFVPPDLADFLRPGLGVIRAFVELGSLGFSLKAALLGDNAHIAVWEALRWSVVLLFVGALFGRAIVGLGRRIYSGDPLAQRFGLLAIVSLAPTYLFSIVYGGTEYHMHSTALPFVCIALALGLDGFRPVRLGPIPSTAGVGALAVLVGAINLIGTCLPDLRSDGGFPMALARKAARQLPPKSLLVVTGQDFRGSVIGVVTYHARVKVLNVANEVDYYGTEAWQPRMQSAMAASIDSGGQIAVLSDFVGIPTPGGLKLSEREHPVPSFAEVASALNGWTHVCTWNVEGYSFVTIAPPGTDPPTTCTGDGASMTSGAGAVNRVLQPETGGLRP